MFLNMTERLMLEFKYSHPDAELTQEQLIAELQRVYDRMSAPPDLMTLVIAHCIYNEEQFMNDILMDDLKINDVDIIHIMDGAWKLHDGTPESTDKTKEIIMAFKEKAEAIGIRVIYEAHPNGEVWKSESEKRNYQFKRIHEIVGNTPHYVFVKDGDETIHFMSGRKRIWLKGDLLKIHNEHKDLKIGLVNVCPFYFDNMMTTPRLFPSGEGYHYYTEKPMAICDANHKLVSDYHPAIGYNDTKLSFLLRAFILINRLHIREKERRDKKIPYSNHYNSVVGERKKPCKFKGFGMGSVNNAKLA